MKRVAWVALGVAAVAGVAPASARDLNPPRQATSSWCERNADASAGTDFGREVAFFLGVGTNTNREVLSAYACYDTRSPGDGRRSGLASAWWDPEYGSAGATCIRQAPAAVVSCRRNAISLPAEGTTPVTHEGEPWWLRLLDVEIDYGFDGGRVEGGMRADDRCVEGTCVAVAGYRAAADPVVVFRVAGRECRSQGGISCARNEAGNGATLGEQGGLLAVAAGGEGIDVPQVCVDARPDADGRC